MDDFQHKLTLGKIGKLKTLKAKELLIRELLGTVDTSYHYRYSSPNGEELKDVNLYRCVMAILKEFDVERLPDKLRRQIRHLEEHYADYLTSNGTYAQFIHVFEFNTTVQFSYLSVKDFIKLARVFGNNVIPFEFIYRLRTESYVGSILGDMPVNLVVRKNRVASYSNQTTVLQLELIKLKLGTGYTVLEDALAEVYGSIVVDNITARTTAEVTTRVTNLLTASKTVANRLNA